MQSKKDRLASGTARVGLLINPLGGKARKRIDTIRQVVATIPQALIYEASDLQGFHTSIDLLLNAEVDLLVIVGGDGTAQAIMTYLFSICPPHQWPLMVIVPGGTTNMTSLDLGVKGRPDEALKRLCAILQHPVELNFAQRAAICIEQSGADKIYGMFFAVGLIARGVKFSRSDVKKIGITGGIFTILIMLRSLFGMLLGQQNKEWAPVDLTITQENGVVHQDTYLFAMVSALDHLLLNIRPYWGNEQAPLHMTMVEQARKRLWQALWPLLTGRGEKLKAADGYHSHNANTLQLNMDDEFIVDGELFRSNGQQAPLRISATDPITFLVP